MPKKNTPIEIFEQSDQLLHCYMRFYTHPFLLWPAWSSYKQKNTPTENFEQSDCLLHSYMPKKNTPIENF